MSMDLMAKIVMKILLVFAFAVLNSVDSGRYFFSAPSLNVFNLPIFLHLIPIFLHYFSHFLPSILIPSKFRESNSLRTNRKMANRRQKKRGEELKSRPSDL